MDLKDLIVLAFQVSIIATVFGFGLRATIDDVLYLIRRPGLLFRSLLAMFVIVPVIAMSLARALQFPHAVEAALIALAISPLPPLIPNRLIKSGGRESYSISLMLTVSVLSILIVPFAVEVMERYYNRPLMLSPMYVAVMVVLFILLPFAAGMVFKAAEPALANRVEAPISVLGKVLLLLAGLAVLLATLPAIWALVGNGTVLAIAVFVIAALAVGHLLGEPDHEESAVLAIASACRHPGIAFAIATANVSEENFGAVILLYLLISALICLPYIMWLKSVALHGGISGTRL